MMVKFQVAHSELHTEENLGVTKYQGQVYLVDTLNVLGLSTLSMGVKRLGNQHFDIHWDQRVDLREAS